jgi:hypothetical protein
MVEQAWTEPVVAGLVAVAALAWALRSRWTVLFAALAMASKQFLWPFVPLLLRVPGFDRRSIVVAIIVLVALFLPFFAWGPERFWYGVVAEHWSGESVHLAYPDIPPGDPWPFSTTMAIHMRQYGIEWPLWVGTLLWLAAAAGFAGARDRGLGTLVVTAACAVGCLSFFGAAFHPNYMWLLPTLAVLGVLADRARAASEPGALSLSVAGAATASPGLAGAEARGSGGGPDETA